MLVDVCVAGTVTRLVDAGAIVAASAEADGSDSAGAIAVSAEADESDCGGVVLVASTEASPEDSELSESPGVASAASAEALPPIRGLGNSEHRSQREEQAEQHRKSHRANGAPVDLFRSHHRAPPTLWLSR